MSSRYTAPEIRFGIAVVCAFRCSWCRRRGDDVYDPDGDYWQIDHVKPRAAGGDDEIGNKTLCCVACNRGKGDRRYLAPPHHPLTEGMIAEALDGWYAEHPRASKMRWWMDDAASARPAQSGSPSQEEQRSSGPPSPDSPEVQQALERLSRGMEAIAARILQNEERAREEQEPGSPLGRERPPPRAAHKKRGPITPPGSAAQQHHQAAPSPPE